jgi:hypothetical protein
MIPISMVLADDSLNVQITEPSDNFIDDNYGNPYMIVGDVEDDNFTFDCTADGGSDGTLYYDWNFGSGNPSSNDDGDNTQSSYGPVSFTEGTSVTVNVTKENDNGDTCAKGSDTLTVSYATITPSTNQETGNSTTGKEDGSIYYIDSTNDRLLPEGNASANKTTLQDDATISCDYDLSCDSGLTSVNLGSLQSSDPSWHTTFTDDGNDVSNVTLDGSGNAYFTMNTYYSNVESADTSFEIYTTTNQSTSKFIDYNMTNNPPDNYDAYFAENFQITVYYCPIESSMSSQGYPTNTTPVPAYVKNTSATKTVNVNTVLYNRINKGEGCILLDDISGLAPNNVLCAVGGGKYQLWPYPIGDHNNQLFGASDDNSQFSNWDGYPSCAASKSDFSSGSSKESGDVAAIDDNDVFNKLGYIRWRVADVGSGIGTHHIDCYWGSDAPSAFPLGKKSKAYKKYLDIPSHCSLNESDVNVFMGANQE